MCKSSAWLVLFSALLAFGLGQIASAEQPSRLGLPETQQQPPVVFNRPQPPPKLEEGPPPQKLPTPGRKDLAEEPIDLVEFRDLPLQDAMRLLSQQTGVKIVPSAEASKLKISLYLEKITPLVVVDAITKSNGLIFRRDADTGIIRIFTPKENQRDLTSFREEHTEVFTLLYPNAVNTATAIRDLFGSRVLLSYGTTEDRVTRDLQERFRRFDLLNSRSLGLGIFQGTSVGVGGAGIGGVGVGGYGVGGFGVSGLGVGGAGGIGGGAYGGGGGLYGGAMVGPGGPGYAPGTQLRDARDPYRSDARPEQRLEGLTPEEIQELEKAFTTKEAPDRTILLELLRRRPATIFVTVVKEHNQLIVRTSDPETLEQIRQLVHQIDVPTPVVLLEVKVLQISLQDDFNSVFDYQFTNGILSAGSFTTGNILPPFADKDSSAVRRFEAINPGPVGNAPSQNLVYQVVSANFRARLQLLESANRVTELATPLLMTANNEVSRIFSGSAVPITVGYSPPQSITGVGATTTVLSTPITTYQDIGTSLLITPNINADRSVTLRILLEGSTINPGGGTIPFVNADGTVTQVSVDTVQQKTVTATVVAQDGLAIALGGLIQEGLSDTRSEVPVIGKIPYVGFFFRRQATQRTRSELVVMIRPFVLTTPCDSANVSRSMLEATSIHPNVPQGGLGSLGTYVPAEVLRPNPPRSELQKIFRTHIILPKDF